MLRLPPLRKWKKSTGSKCCSDEQESTFVILARHSTRKGSRWRCFERSGETIGEYNFAGQYQQAPAPLEGGMIKMVGSRPIKMQSCHMLLNSSFRAGTRQTR